MNPCDKIFQIEILLQNDILMYFQFEILINTNVNKWIGIGSQIVCRQMLDKLEMRKRIIVIADLDKWVKVKLNYFMWTISVKAKNILRLQQTNILKIPLIVFGKFTSRCLSLFCNMSKQIKN